MAQSLVAVSEVAILLTIMIIRDHRLLNVVFWDGVGRILSVTGFSVLAAFVMISIFPLNVADTGIITLGTKFGSIALVTILVHLGISSLFGLEEARPVIDKARQFILRPIKLDL